MASKPTGRPTVRQQRERWVVRVDGIGTESGKHRQRQLGTYTSRRSAQRAASASAFAESGDVGSNRGTVGALVDSWVAGRVHVPAKSRMQYERAAAQIRRDLGAVRVDRLGREDVACWLERPDRTATSSPG